MDTRQTILTCARDLYQTKGMAGFSMRAVARCAGISATAIYRHFDDKEDLLWEVVADGHLILAQYLRQGLQGVDARSRLMAGAMAYLDFALAHRSHYLVMFGANPVEIGYQTLRAKSGEEMTVTFQMFIDRVREFIGTLPARSHDPIAWTYTLWGQIHGLVTLYFRVPADPERAASLPPQVSSPEAFREFYRWSVETLLTGLASSESPPESPQAKKTRRS